MIERGGRIQELNVEKWRENWEVPFHSPDEKEEWCKYECPYCGTVDDVPGFVIDEFAMGKKLKKGEKPGVACPECNREMKYKSSYYKYPYRNQ
jgi:hypothetical protein